MTLGSSRRSKKDRKWTLRQKKLASPPPGTMIGRYQVVRPLAAGGMAQILLARELVDGGGERLVVLKRALPMVSTDEDLMAMFHDEIRIASRLSHPGIASVYEVSNSEKWTYIAMELIDGLSARQLYSRCQQTTIPLPHVIAIGCRVAEALHYAHSLTDDDGQCLGIIHRDVTPENIMISRYGEVKLVDFGVARAANQSHKTRDGVIRGKYPYLAPEIVIGEAYDRCVDIFSLGVVLYELLTGARLFKRRTDPETLTAVCSAPIPKPSSLRALVPNELDDVLLKALRRDPEKRYQRADELCLDLESVARAKGLFDTSQALGRFVQKKGRSNLDQLSDDERRIAHFSTPPPHTPVPCQEETRESSRPSAVVSTLLGVGEAISSAEALARSLGSILRGGETPHPIPRPATPSPWSKSLVEIHSKISGHKVPNIDVHAETPLDGSESTESAEESTTS